MKAFGKRLRGGEKDALHTPFVRAVLAGHVAGWEGASLYAGVALDGRGSSGVVCRADFVLVHREKRLLGLVEAKLARSREFRHGMLEQALMYCEMAHRLRQQGSDALAVRLRDDKHAGGPLVRPQDLVEIDQRHHFVPLLVVDRWGGGAGATVGVTKSFLDECFERAGLPLVQVHVRDEERFVRLPR